MAAHRERAKVGRAIVRRLGLAVVAALALCAILGSAPASATRLCEAPELPCVVEDQYPVGTEISAPGTEAAVIEVNLEGSPATITCAETSLQGKSTSQAGGKEHSPRELLADVTSWSLGSCKESFANTACTATAEGLPWGGAVLWTEGSDGDLSLDESEEGTSGWRIACPKVSVDCTYALEGPLDLSGGSPATLAAAKVPLVATPNSETGCPGSEPTFSAAYEVEAPDPLYVAGDDYHDVRRNGGVANANFDFDGIDDYRVDAGIAFLDFGIHKLDGGFGANVVHKTDCVNPDPQREKEEESFGPPDPEDPDWRPNKRLNDLTETTDYGCLENAGEPSAWQESNGWGKAIQSAGKAARSEGFTGLGGIAPGARVTLVRSLARGDLIGGYPNPEYDPEDPESPQYLPELGISHIIAGIDWATSTREDADPENDVDVIDTVALCPQKGDPEVEEMGAGPFACDNTVLDEAIADAIDHGVVVVANIQVLENELDPLTIVNNPDVLTASLVIDTDGRPGGEGPYLCDELPDDQLRHDSDYGTLVDMADAGCGDTAGSSSRAAGAAAALASQCHPEDRAGVEYIVDTLMAEGETGEISEGGWKDVITKEVEGEEVEVAPDSWKEPLLNLSDEEVFNPIMIDTETEEKEEQAEDCSWRSHQAESDVNGDGRADLLFLDGTAEGAKLLPGTFESVEGTPTEQGFDLEAAVTSLKGELDPALQDGEGSYALDSADVNGDRKADLITAVGGKGVYVYPGKADGSFGSSVESAKGMTLSIDGSEGEIEPFAVADVNGDERADLVAKIGGAAPGFIVTLPGEEDGSFGEFLVTSKVLDSALLDGEGEYPLDVIDVTGEELDEPEAEPIDYEAKHSYADLVTIGTDGKLNVYKGKSDGRFVKTPVQTEGVNPIFDDGEGVEPIGLGDIDRDRRADLLVLDGQDPKLYRGQADGSFAAAEEPYEGEIDSSLLDGKGQELIGLLDYSRDGLADLVAVTDEGELLTYTAQRDKTFAEPVAAEGSVSTLRSGGALEPVASKPLLRRLTCGEGGCQYTLPVHAPTIRSTAYPVSLSGAGFSVFATAAGSFECAQASWSGTLAGPATLLDLPPAYGECTVAGLPATVTTNSCRYQLGVLDVGPPYSGTLDVPCEEEGDAIEFKAFTAETKVLLCTAKLGLQKEPATGLGLSTKGSGAERTVQTSGEASSLEYQLVGKFCGVPAGPYSDGALQGTATLGGKNEQETTTAVFINGEGSE